MSDRHPHYRYALEHFTGEGRSLGQTLVTPDFGPAREWAYFEAVRRGALPLVTAPAGGAVEPLWSDELGPPHLRGIRVAGSEFGSAYFLELAQRQAAAYVERGELARGDRYRYRVCAYPVEPEPEAAPAFAVEALAEPIALGGGALAERLAASDAVGEHDALDAPVFVADLVLREVCALAEQAGELETGGVLFGRLHRDATAAEVFAEVTAQIPARHAEARGTSFAFTPETWAAADAALVLRGAGEIMLGWWHSHPWFCRRCPEERRRECVFAEPSFSAEDVHLHRTCFPQAWQLALLVSDLGALGSGHGELGSGHGPRGRVPTLYGWRRGKVEERGFRKLRAREEER